MHCNNAAQKVDGKEQKTGGNVGTELRLRGIKVRQCRNRNQDSEEQKPGNAERN